MRRVFFCKPATETLAQGQSQKKSQKFWHATETLIKWRATVDEDGHYSFAVAL
jgi:hypothetical protein